MPDVHDIVPTFFVQDVRRSAEWYERVLGFTNAFILGEPGQDASYGGVNSGLDAYLARIEAAGQALTSALKDHPEYGMREATVRDPDGNDLYLGQSLGD